MIYESNSVLKTHEIAQKLAKKLKKGDVVCLDGELGAGKTAFTQGLCSALGVSDYVSSPTYTIVNCYSGKFKIYHIDAYRIEDCDEMYEIGFDEFLDDGICIIEWSSIIEDILPKDRIRITIKRNIEKGDNSRIIEIAGTEVED